MVLWDACKTVTIKRSNLTMARNHCALTKRAENCVECEDWELPVRTVEGWCHYASRAINTALLRREVSTKFETRTGELRHVGAKMRLQRQVCGEIYVWKYCSVRSRLWHRRVLGEWRREQELDISTCAARRTRGVLVGVVSFDLHERLWFVRTARVGRVAKRAMWF